jgi:hypothetical protein
MSGMAVPPPGLDTRKINTDAQRLRGALMLRTQWVVRRTSR